MFKREIVGDTSFGERFDVFVGGFRVQHVFFAIGGGINGAIGDERFGNAEFVVGALFFGFGLGFALQIEAGVLVVFGQDVGCDNLRVFVRVFDVIV